MNDDRPIGYRLMVVAEWIAANTVPCAADGVEHDCAYDFLHVEVESARAFIAGVERAAAVKALREAAFTGYFGTNAQSTLLRLAELREADRIEGGGSA